MCMISKINSLFTNLVIELQKKVSNYLIFTWFKKILTKYKWFVFNPLHSCFAVILI